MREFYVVAPVFFVLGGLAVGFWTSKIWPWIKAGEAASTARLEAEARAVAAKAAAAAKAEGEKVVSTAEKKI